MATKQTSQTRDRCPLMRGREKWVTIVWQNSLTSCYASIRPRSWTWCSSRPQPRQATTWSSCSEGWPPPCLAWRALSQRRMIWPRFGMFGLDSRMSIEERFYHSSISGDLERHPCAWEAAGEWLHMLGGRPVISWQSAWNTMVMVWPVKRVTENARRQWVTWSETCLRSQGTQHISISICRRLIQYLNNTLHKCRGP